MSDVLTFCSVEIKQLKQCLGQGDLGLIPDVLEANQDYLYHEEDFDDGPSAYLTPQEALMRLLTGKTAPACTDLTGRSTEIRCLTLALEMLCSYMNEAIRMPEFEDLHWTFFDEFKYTNELLSQPLPFPFPYDKEGIIIGYQSRERVKELAETIDEKFPEHQDSEINAVRFVYQEMLETIAEEENDLIAFLS